MTWFHHLDLRVPSSFVRLGISFFVFSFCKPVSINRTKDNRQGAISRLCVSDGEASKGRCPKDGTIKVLLSAQEASLGEKSDKKIMEFQKPGIRSGDWVYAYSRLGIGKISTPSSAKFNYQGGGASLGKSITQNLTSMEKGLSSFRVVISEEAKKDLEDPLELVSSVADVTPEKSSYGMLLVFRSINMKDLVEESAAKKYRFVKKVLDTDEVKTKTVTASAESVTVLSVSSEDLMGQDLAWVRSGVSWRVASGKVAACNRALITWSLSVDGNLLQKDGPHLVDANTSQGFSAMQGLVKEKLKNGSVISLSAVLEHDSSGGSKDCSLDIKEPATLTAVVFRSLYDFGTDYLSAHFLHKGVSAGIESTRLNARDSGPPIETISQFSWEHKKGDLLIFDAWGNLNAEDRLQSTKTYLQVTRAPEGLGSHVVQTDYKGPSAWRNIHLSESLIEEQDVKQTKFFITAMSLNPDAKPVNFEEGGLSIFHFRRLGEKE